MLSTIDPDKTLPEREEIEQVRRLLFGEMQEANKQRMDTLEAAMVDMRARLEQQIGALEAANTASHLNFIRSLGAALMELGQQISRMADAASGNSAAAAVTGAEQFRNSGRNDTFGEANTSGVTAAPDMTGHE